MRSIPLRSAFGIEARDSKGLGFYPAGAFGNEPYLAQAMMGIDVDNNVYSAQVPTTSVYENDIWYEKVNTQEWQKIADLLGVGTVKKNDGTYSFTGDYLVVVGQDWK